MDCDGFDSGVGGLQRRGAGSRHNGHARDYRYSNGDGDFYPAGHYDIGCYSYEGCYTDCDPNSHENAGRRSYSNHLAHSSKLFGAARPGSEEEPDDQPAA